MHSKLRKAVQKASIFLPKAGIKTASSRATPYFSCTCPFCVFQAKQRETPQYNREDKLLGMAKSNGKPRGFTWLMKQLSEIPVKVLSPDILLFQNGKPSALINSASGPSVKLNTFLDKLGLTDILKQFTKLVRNRKKGDSSSNRLSERRSMGGDAYGKEIVIIRYIANGCAKNEEGPIRVLNEKEFFKLMLERPGNPVWKTIVYVQTVLKTKSGIGDIVNITYFSDMINEEIQEDKDLMYKHPRKYCQFVCQSIAKALYIHSHVELLCMKAEFMIDDNRKIWFTYASDVFVREVDPPSPKFVPEKNKVNARILNSILDRHLEQFGENSLYTKYKDLLTEKYESAKRKVGADKMLGVYSDDIQRIGKSVLAALRSKSSNIKKEAKKVDLLNEKRTMKRLNYFKHIRKRSSSADIFFNSR